MTQAPAEVSGVSRGLRLRVSGHYRVWGTCLKPMSPAFSGSPAKDTVWAQCAKAVQTRGIVRGVCAGTKHRRGRDGEGFLL